MDTRRLIEFQKSLKSQEVSWDSLLKKQLEDYFGADFDEVQVFVVDEISILPRLTAFALGKSIYFHKDHWDPSTTEGLKLLAHELAHVIQQNRGLLRLEVRAQVRANDSVSPEMEAHLAMKGLGRLDHFIVRNRVLMPYPQGFDSSDRILIGDFSQAMSVIRTVANQTALPRQLSPLSRMGRRPPRPGRRQELDRLSPALDRPMNYPDFVLGMGGRIIGRGMGPDLGTTHGIRYFYTCRGGLIDLTHFCQLMNWGRLVGYRVAMAAGEGNEVQQGFRALLGSEGAASSFHSPEDQESNRLGAQFGRRLHGGETVSQFCGSLRGFMQSLGPVDLVDLDIDAIVRWYSSWFNRGRGVPDCSQFRLER